MSDNEETNEAIETRIIDNKDVFLQSLVKTVNGGNISIGVTLNVGGFLVSGLLIGGKEYFETFADDFVSGLGLAEAENSKSIRASFAKNGDIYNSDETANLKPRITTYIHLKDARCFTTTGSPTPSNGVLWRGKISEVDGFSIGNLNYDNT